MMRASFTLCFTLGAALVLAADSNELAVARQALRDGLWNVARRHAAADGTDESKLVILESFASENNWLAVANSLRDWQVSPTNRGFGYYIAVTNGDFKLAAELLRKEGAASGIVAAKMLEAELCERASDRKGAEALWREVIAMSNVAERAFVTAAANLGEIAPLRAALARAKSVQLRQLASLRLGVALLKAAETREEGEKFIRAVVADSPDVVGAKEAFLAMADAELAAKDYSRSAKTYGDAVETWPEVAKFASVYLGRGEALLGQGRREDAMVALVRAETLASTDEEKAASIVRQGDILNDQGKSDEGMARYRAVLEKYPATAIAGPLKRVVEIRDLETRGRALYREYRFAEAMKIFAEVASADPSRKAPMEYCMVLCLYGQHEDSSALDRAKALADGCEDARVRSEAVLWLAKFTYNRGEWKESGRRFRAFAELAPTSPKAPEALVWATRAAYADNDYALTIQSATALTERYPSSPARIAALLVQGEALIQLARFDEAVLVLDGIAAADAVSEEERLKAKLLRADALFAMGADNSARYTAALEAYQALRFAGTLSSGVRLTVSFKIARTLEKLRRRDEAIDEYYTQVVLAYRDGRLRGERYDDEARAAFSRAAFRLADEFESRGKIAQTLGVLGLVAESDVPAADEAERRIDRISSKGNFL